MTNSNTTPVKTGEGKPSTGGGGNTLRYGLSLPLAAAATIGLTLSMAALIATEFTPQDKTKTASFEINPRIDDIVVPLRQEKPDPLKEVETPPPPPTVATYKTAAVNIPIIKEVGKIEPFKMDVIDIGGGVTVRMDTPSTPLVRIPPIFPARFLQGDVSGYCRVRFDISPDGVPFNVQTTSCTNSQLKSATVKSVQKWRYAPKVQDGRAVSRSGLETTIRFDLMGNRGEILPLPRGY